MPRFDDIRLDQAEFRLLRELFNEHCGILFTPESRPVIERRLRDRLAAHGLASFGEYYQLLRYDERGRAELDEAVDLVTINETYFLRESYQLRAFKDELLPALRASQGRERLSVWSAGCSTGEEVYSIAIVTRESGLFPARCVRVFGSDISRRCLAHARRGVYGPSAFRAMAHDIRKRYFTDRPDGAHVADELRSMCQFGQLNLLDVPRAAVVGRVDVVFCRNVLIYFDDASRRRVIDMFYDRLLPGGYLLLGHSESLLNLSTAFELVHLREDLVYRKPTSSTRVWSVSESLRRPVIVGGSAVAAPASAPKPPVIVGGSAVAAPASAPKPPVIVGGSAVAAPASAPKPPVEARPSVEPGPTLRAPAEPSKAPAAPDQTTRPPKGGR